MYEKKHSCPHCGLKFLLIQTLDNHIDTEHKENVIDIEIMKSEENLETNSKSVDEESYNLDTSSEVSMSKPFTCHHCKEAFSSERNMELHIDFHHDLKNEEKNPYKCLECDFSCLQKEEFSTHISSVHEVKKPYECSKCNISFLQKEEFSTHNSSVHEVKKSSYKSPQSEIDRLQQFVKRGKAEKIH